MANVNESALEWLERVILDELDAIIDERLAAKGKFHTPNQRLVGREAMRKRIAPILKDEPRAAELQALGEARVRAGIRRIYNSGLS